MRSTCGGSVPGLAGRVGGWGCASHLWPPRVSSAPAVGVSGGIAVDRHEVRPPRLGRALRDCIEDAATGHAAASSAWRAGLLPSAAVPHVAAVHSGDIRIQHDASVLDRVCVRLTDVHGRRGHLVMQEAADHVALWARRPRCLRVLCGVEGVHDDTDLAELAAARHGTCKARVQVVRDVHRGRRRLRRRQGRSAWGWRWGQPWALLSREATIALAVDFVVDARQEVVGGLTRLGGGDEPHVRALAYGAARLAFAALVTVSCDLLQPAKPGAQGRLLGRGGRRRQRRGRLQRRRGRRPQGRRTSRRMRWRVLRWTLRRRSPGHSFHARAAGESALQRDVPLVAEASLDPGRAKLGLRVLIEAPRWWTLWRQRWERWQRTRNWWHDLRRSASDAGKSIQCGCWILGRSQ